MKNKIFIWILKGRTLVICKLLINCLFISESYHGYDGLMTVEDRAWKSNLPQAFIDAGIELGYSLTDINGANQTGILL